MTPYTLPEPSREFLCTKCGGVTPTPESTDKEHPECPCGYSMFAQPKRYPLSEVHAAYVAGLAEGRKVPEGWTATSKAMPVSSTPVLADIGRKYPIRACWVAKFSEEIGASDFQGDEDYDEKTDTCYWPEGWYEWNQFEETHWRVEEEVKHWMPLPAAPEPSHE